MRIITKKRIKEAMSKHPQWRVGLNLWIEAFDKPWLDLESYDDIKNTWQETSGWNTGRLDRQQLKTEDDHDSLFDLYIFTVHDNDCYLLTRCRNQSLYVKAILSHADYEKWRQHNAHQDRGNTHNAQQ